CDGPVYIRAREDGGTTKKFSINAIWEQIIGARMLLPAPRYGQPILMRPDAFRWLPVKGAPGAYRKHLGSFTERGVAAAMLMLKPEASLVLAPSEAIRL